MDAPLPTPAARSDALRIAQLERDHAQLERDNAELAQQLRDAQQSLANVRRAYVRALEQLQLLQRRLYIAKAERLDTRSEQLAFDGMLEQVQQLAKTIEDEEARVEAESSDEPEIDKPADKPAAKPRNHTPHGRRDLSKSRMITVRVEVLDPEFEGKVERIGFDEQSTLGYQRGGPRRLILMRAVYKLPELSTAGAPADPASGPTMLSIPDSATPETDSKSVFVKAPMPKMLFKRALLAPSMIAHILVSKYTMGMPFYRLEERFAQEGLPLDRSMMCRYAEDAGATLGAIVEAMSKDALAHAFCLSTDATGVSIQPGRLAERGRSACLKGHFFVILADKDHVLFEYQAKHTSAAVSSMFQGYSGYVQADAHAIYDALFRGDASQGNLDVGAHNAPPLEVGCWAHARRKFWEAAVCKHALGVEGLRRIAVLYATDALLADLAPARRKAQRDAHLRPQLDAFFAWAKAEHARVQERGRVATALGYVLNQQGALLRFLEDGRLRMDNNGSERALRPIAVGRNAWLFFGSDDHASAAANLFSLLASCKLHGVEPEGYLMDLIHVMPYWPRERYLELCPRDWARTRARIAPSELVHEIGHITLPPPLPAEENQDSS